jgi:hypothetical protein
VSTYELIVTGTAKSNQLPGVFERFFETKTARDAERTMAFFAPDAVRYTDATLGWEFDSHAALSTAMEQGMPGWARKARSCTWSTRRRCSAAS